MGEDDRRILVHCCCGPCATSSVERLLDEGWQPVLFFSNSNIFPHEEFLKRYGELVKVACVHSLEVIMEEQDHESWLEYIKGHEDEPEGAGRCDLCFSYNLERAALKAQELGISHFCTTLTVSRFKNSSRIFAQGRRHEGFEEIDFKKKNGFSRSVQLSREMNLYRQSYCGCEFSLGRRG